MPMRGQRQMARAMPCCCSFPSLPLRLAHALTGKAAAPPRAPPPLCHCPSLLASSLAIRSITSLASLLSQPSQGEGVIADSAMPAMTEARRSWSSPWPEPSHSLLFLPSASPRALEAHTKLSCTRHGRSLPARRRTPAAVCHACRRPS
jgi:hypothetical protein